MSGNELLMVWSQRPVLSFMVWFVVSILLLYLARLPAHRLIRSASLVIRNMFRIGARSVNNAEKKLVIRNREVLLANGQEATEHLLEREFQRVHTVVSRDLGSYPNLHRQLSEQITRIDEDYQQAIDVPPDPPGWTKAVEAVARLRNDDSGMVGKILGDIHTTVKKSQQLALNEYRQASSKRHSLLKKMMPTWRRMSKTLGAVNDSIQGLDERSRVIDEQMEHYQQIRNKVPQAERALSSSSLTQFFIAGVVLTIAMIGGVINFYLIALPMSEMVGGNSMLGPFRTSSIAALVIIMLEIAMGLFLMESLRITRMFPIIGSMDDQMRRRMMWITLTLLTVLACIESSLAFMRDLLAADREALRQTLSGIQAANPEFRWIPSMGQMIMGFVLPFALTFVAIPLESFIHASRTVMGIVMIGLLRACETVLRFLGNTAYHLGITLINIYDLVIFIPLRLEEWRLHHRQARPHDSRQEKKAVDTIGGNYSSDQTTVPFKEGHRI